MSSRNKLKHKIARRNGALAAGTKTPEGIAKSSMNALRHGLTAKSLILTNESRPAFEELLNQYVETFKPANTVELDYVHDMVAARWRIQRCRFLQTATLDLEMDKQEAEVTKRFHQIDQCTRLALATAHLANTEKFLDLLLRYETGYSRALERAQRSLEKLQAARAQSMESEELRNDPPPAIEPPPPQPDSPKNEPPQPAAPEHCTENYETKPLPSNVKPETKLDDPNHKVRN